MNILNYKGYYAKVEYSAEDNILYGKVEGINDLVDFEATELSEVQKSFEDAVDGYLEVCNEIGKDPNKAYKGTFNVRVDPELHRKLANEAIRLGTTLNDIMVRSCLTYFQYGTLMEKLCEIQSRVNDLSSFSVTLIKNTSDMWNANTQLNFNGYMGYMKNLSGGSR